MAPPPPGLVIVGRVRKAHGIRGEVVVESFTDAPEAVFAPGRRLFTSPDAEVTAADSAEAHVATMRPFMEGWLVRFDEVADRTAAEQWRDLWLLLPEEELEPAGEGEIYIHDLVGLSVRLTSGEAVGVVRQVYELPQGLMLDVERPGRPGALVPFLEEIVRALDRESRTLVIDPPDGLLE